ncbi:enterotoxin A family protein [Neisseria animaloris]|uniref:scabin-related ADP-ribosyltransferase n=1 Tax=Neisseria animaloris TaxID=326522 RepID=UPI00131A9AC2|nr:enterotoxin A family protein [Neisseria animaloris]
MLGRGNLYQFAPNAQSWVDVLGLCNTTFRGDTRGPNIIFKIGFKPKGSSGDLLLHAKDNNIPPSNFVSTSKSREVTEQFETQFGTSDGFVYAIKSRNGIDVNATLGSKSPYPHEAEIAIPNGVSSQDILGATPISKDGKLANYSIINLNRRR